MSANNKFNFTNLILGLVFGLFLSTFFTLFFLGVISVNISFWIGVMVSLFVLLVSFFLLQNLLIKRLTGENSKEEGPITTKEALQQIGEATIQVALEKLPENQKIAVGKKGSIIVNYLVNAYLRRKILGGLTTIFLAIAGLLGILVLINQNNLIEGQNEKIDLQNNLLEAERRGALIVMMSNIMDRVDDELRAEGNEKDTLSDLLIGRIAALSQSFKPYRSLEGGQLSDKELSPERGQLLTVLVKTRLDSTTYQKIYDRVQFQQADLNGADFNDAKLNSVKLSIADLSNADLNGVDFSDAKLSAVKFSVADLSYAKLSYANLNGASLLEANLTLADLSYANLSQSDLKGAYLFEANLSYANLNSADLSGAYLSGATLLESDLTNANLSGADLSATTDLTYQVLLSTHSLHEAKGIQEEWMDQLKAEKPCLFSSKGCQ